MTANETRDLMWMGSPTKTIAKFIVHSLFAVRFASVDSSIPARSHTFVEIDHEIISTVILLPSAESS